MSSAWRFVFSVAVVVAALAVQTLSERFDGHQVFEVKAKTSEELQRLSEILSHFDVWKQPSIGRSGDVLVRPDQTEQFLQSMKINQIDFQLKIENVQTWVKFEFEL